MLSIGTFERAREARRTRYAAYSRVHRDETTPAANQAVQRLETGIR
jgi:hypothetical protein